jgi:uncharacterized OsmC-like protein
MPKVKARATLIENVHSRVDNQRNHSVECDLPPPAGGNDCGPTALELCLMSLADCGMTIFADICKKSNIKLNKLDVTVEADKSPDSPIISGVLMKVDVSSPARKELLEAAWRRTEANCPVFFIFREPTQIKVDYDGKTELK